ncbi:DinB family protein, partial [Staphylococcus hominis]
SKGNQHVVDLERYRQLFAPGSKQADWPQIEGGVPNIDEILKDIQTIPERARQLTEEQLTQTLDQPIAGFSTVEGLLMLNAIHI